MRIPQNKAELLLAIDTNFSKLFKALQAVPESRVRGQGTAREPP
ncbi:ClbS/DfsB family four-helix bundle protein [Aeromonas veronii]